MIRMDFQGRSSRRSPGPRRAPSFDGLERRPLTRGAWVDVRRDWLPDADERPRAAGRRRAVAGRAAADVRPASSTSRGWCTPTAIGEPLPHPVLDEARDALSEHYLPELGEPFVTAGCCYYRDGRDSVAWHGDRSAAAAARTRWSRSSRSATRAGWRCARAAAASRSSVEMGHGDLRRDGRLLPAHLGARRTQGRARRPADLGAVPPAQRVLGDCARPRTGTRLSMSITDSTAPGHPETTTAFGELEIAYDDRVLEPRTWTADQSRWAAELSTVAPDGPMLELCSGAGQIGLLAVARHRAAPGLRRPRPGRLRLRPRNADAAGLAHLVEVREGRLEEAVTADERFALVIADPPWVPRAETARFPEDPLVAIDGGDDGLDVARVCAQVAGRHLAAGRLGDPAARHPRAQAARFSDAAAGHSACWPARSATGERGVLVRIDRPRKRPRRSATTATSRRYPASTSDGSAPYGVNNATGRLGGAGVGAADLVGAVAPGQVAGSGRSGTPR